MPAPTAESIYTFLKAEMIAQGFKRQQYVSGALVTNVTELPEQMEPMLRAIANAVSKQWVVWQTTQVVVTPVGPGSLP